jgi:hypothetical protein
MKKRRFRELDRNWDMVEETNSDTLQAIMHCEDDYSLQKRKNRSSNNSGSFIGLKSKDPINNKRSIKLNKKTLNKVC